MRNFGFESSFCKVNLWLNNFNQNKKFRFREILLDNFQMEHFQVIATCRIYFQKYVGAEKENIQVGTMKLEICRAEIDKRGNKSGYRHDADLDTDMMRIRIPTWCGSGYRQDADPDTDMMRIRIPTWCGSGSAQLICVYLDRDLSVHVDLDMTSLREKK